MFALAAASAYAPSPIIVQLTEPASVLEVLLQFMAPARSHRVRWKAALPEALDVVAAFDKYEVWRGIDYTKHQLFAPIAGGRQPSSRSSYSGGNFDHELLLYAFAHHFGYEEMRDDALSFLYASSAGSAHRKRWERRLREVDLGVLGSRLDRYELSTLLLKRHLAVSTLVTSLLPSLLSSANLLQSLSYSSLQEIIQVWNSYALCGTSACLLDANAHLGELFGKGVGGESWLGGGKDWTGPIMVVFPELLRGFREMEAGLESDDE
ncbi:hypothetical protein MNV49_006377 [Pseudohyphozyma bogoriensis]|nr:hypothetical protein MNV49_006377 [Pseudohyphozyma bogoriensis]